MFPRTYSIMIKTYSVLENDFDLRTDFKNSIFSFSSMHSECVVHENTFQINSSKLWMSKMMLDIGMHQLLSQKDKSTMFKRTQKSTIPCQGHLKVAFSLMRKYISKNIVNYSTVSVKYVKWQNSSLFNLAVSISIVFMLLHDWLQMLKSQI